MQLKIQKRLAAQILKTSGKKIRLDSDRLEDIKEAITKADIKSLIKDKAITEKKERGISGYRINKKRLQKSKGRRIGFGSIKGSKGARRGKKRVWIMGIRAQREFLKSLKDKKIIPLGGMKIFSPILLIGWTVSRAKAHEELRPVPSDSEGTSL